eukprot:301849-Hanusia_phi.AAC.2
MQKCFESCTSCSVADTKHDIIIKKIPEKTPGIQTMNQGVDSARQKAVIALHAACLSNDSSKCEEILRSNPNLVDAKDGFWRSGSGKQAWRYDATPLDGGKKQACHGVIVDCSCPASQKPIPIAQHRKQLCKNMYLCCL